MSPAAGAQTMPAFRARRSSLGVLAAVLMSVALLPATPAPAAAAGGTGFVNMANGYRAEADLGPVAYHSVINTIAAERGRQIERAGEIGHDFDYLRRRFDEEGICWRGFGEIVARNGTGEFSAFGTQWFNSTTHRNIMLGDYTHASGSREQDGDRWYGVMVFVKLCNAKTPAPAPSGFTDLGDSRFVDDIEWLVERGITTGCAPSRFCPDEHVTRGQMATFLDRALGLPDAAADYFVDDDGSSHEWAINSVRAAGITSGCYGARYCPNTKITRAQMAAFLDRALGLPHTDIDFFRDDDGLAHEGAINRVAAAGITEGCGSGRFCPGGTVKRAHMAAFLHRALD